MPAVPSAASSSRPTTAAIPLAAVRGLPFGLRAVQLDLARQMETLPTIHAFCQFAAAQGYNTLVLYLEGRVRTPGFPHRPAATSYSLDDLRAIVDGATACGLDVIPATNILGHAELFFETPHLHALAEERDGTARFAPTTRPSTFDWTVPATVEFWRTYLAELASVCPGPHLHLGMDECWNLGFGPTSAPLRRQQGLGRLFMDVLRQAHEICAGLGKRLWLWDDMFEFFPAEIARLPQDVVLCHWGYDPVVDAGGLRAHFANRERHDWLATYAAHGIDAVVCPWFPWNTETFTAYASRHPVLGGLMTQWEMSTWYLDLARPMVAYCGALWRQPVLDSEAAWDVALRATWPGLPDRHRPAVRAACDLLLGGGPRLAPANEGAWLQGPLTVAERTRARAVELAHLALAATPVPASADAADRTGTDAVALRADLLDYSAFELLHWRLRSSVPAILDPCRDAASEPRLARDLADLTARATPLAARLRLLHDQRRPGMSPVNRLAAHLDAFLALLDRLHAALATPPAPDAHWLVVRVALPDGHGAPRLRIAALDPQGNETAELCHGGPKGGSANEDGAFTYIVPFRAATAPAALRLDVWGWGGYGLMYLETQSRAGRHVPVRVADAVGPVVAAESLLRDDTSVATFGRADYGRAIHHPEQADIHARLTVHLAPAR